MNLIMKLLILMEKNDIKNPSQLAKATSVPYTTLKSIFDGQVNDVSLTTSRKLCNHFGITLDELLDDNIPLGHKKSVRVHKTNTIEIDITDLTDDDIEDIKELARIKRERRKKN